MKDILTYLKDVLTLLTGVIGGLTALVVAILALGKLFRRDKTDAPEKGHAVKSEASDVLTAKKMGTPSQRAASKPHIPTVRLVVGGVSILAFFVITLVNVYPDPRPL